jgi:hypothetical protein
MDPPDMFDPARGDVDSGVEQPVAGRSSGLGGGSTLAATRLDHPDARRRPASAMLLA